MGRAAEVAAEGAAHWRRRRAEGQHVALHAKLEPAHAVATRLPAAPSDYSSHRARCGSRRSLCRCGPLPGGSARRWGSRSRPTRPAPARSFDRMAPPAKRHVDVMHPGRLHRASFRLAGMLAFRAQVDDGLDSQLSQAVPAFGSGLRAAVDAPGHLVEVRDARRCRIDGPCRDGECGVAGENQERHSTHANRIPPQLWGSALPERLSHQKAKGTYNGSSGPDSGSEKPAWRTRGMGLSLTKKSALDSAL
jgi:hypothetical protein